MEAIRKPFQGIWNVVRFNWQFYVFAFGLAFMVLALNLWIDEKYHGYTALMCSLILFTTLVSLCATLYVYDISDLYKLGWIDKLNLQNIKTLVNIHAGFDETSKLLKSKFPDAQLHVFDFYDPSKHTEISIKRARKLHPPFPNTKSITTHNIPLIDNETDVTFAILAAHEIRDEKESFVFFQELERITKPSGKIVVVEHLRDIANFFAYTIGFLHFLSRASWHKSFKNADLTITSEMKVTPFITVFVLEKYGSTS